MGADPIVDSPRVVPDGALSGLPRGYFPPPGSDAAPLSLTPGGKFDGRLPGPSSFNATQGLEDADRSLANLGSTAAKLPDSVGSAESSLGSFASSLFNFKPGASASGNGGFSVAGLFGGSGSGESGGGSAQALASGGPVRGIGTGTSDSILIRASHGEFVVNSAATARHLPLLHDINSHRMPAFAQGGYVDAGPGPVTARRDVSGAPRDPAGAGQGNGAPVEFHLHDNAGVAVTQKSTRSERGGQRLDVVLDKALADRIGKPGSATSRALETHYGMSRAMVTR